MNADVQVQADPREVEVEDKALVSVTDIVQATRELAGEAVATG